MHLAGTYDGTTWRLYRDGQLLASSIDSSGVSAPNGDWDIGAGTSDASPPVTFDDFDGAIADVRIYNTALSSSAISGLEATPPTVATPAAATPATATGTTAALSVLGADDAGESTLTYTWTTVGTPPAAVSFSANGSNAAKDTTATFTAAGTYSFLVTVTNIAGLTAASSVNVTVTQSLTQIIVSGQPPAVTALDQFGNPLVSQPAFDAESDTISSALALSGNVTVLPAAGSQLTISGGISGGGGLTIADQATVVLTAPNGYSGGTTVSAGTLILANSLALAAGSSLTVGADRASIFASSEDAGPLSVAAAPTITSRFNATGSRSVDLIEKRIPAQIHRLAGPPILPAARPAPSVIHSARNRPAANLAWLEQTFNGSDASDERHKNHLAIRAFDALFAEYGR